MANGSLIALSRPRISTGSTRVALQQPAHAIGLRRSLIGSGRWAVPFSLGLVGGRTIRTELLGDHGEAVPPGVAGQEVKTVKCARDQRSSDYAGPAINIEREQVR
jgi:hypothetical protein